MITNEEYTPENIADQLRANRKQAGVTINEIDRAAYHYESGAVLGKLNKRQLDDAIRTHYKAVQEAEDRKIVPFPQAKPETAAHTC